MTATCTACPWCGYQNNAHTDVARAGHRPRPGDVSICSMCVEVSIFTADTSLRKPTDDEATAILADPRVKSAAAALRESYTVSEAFGLLGKGKP